LHLRAERLRSPTSYPMLSIGPRQDAHIGRCWDARLQPMPVEGPARRHQVRQKLFEWKHRLLDDWLYLAHIVRTSRIRLNRRSGS
jgi:hypothetical protein